MLFEPTSKVDLWCKFSIIYWHGCHPPLIYLDPIIEEISAGEPLTKLGINLLIAVVIFPLHTFIEKRITKTNGRAE